MKRLHLLLLMWPLVGQTQPTPYQWHLQTGLAVIPPAGFRTSMAYDAARDQILYLPGRINGQDDFKGMWRWDGSAWTQPTDVSFTERTNAVGIGFDSVRGVVVLYCLTGFTENDVVRPGHTWEWNGSSWRLASTNGPTNRDNMGMAFDSHRGRTVMFGGNLGFAGPLPRWTWEWDGVNWRVVATNGPSRRVYCAMAYDAKRRVTILFGGADDSICCPVPYRRDTWTWDGTNWTAVAVAGPTARYAHNMVYDSIRERVLLYGGVDGTQPSNEEGLTDLWEWDGSQWILSSASGPGHVGAVMAFDSRRNEAVLFGGSRGRTNLTETWLLRLHETWVDFGYLGMETGAFSSPFNTLSEGVTAAPSGSAVKIKAGASAERLTISKRLSVQAFGGPVTIGQ